MSHKLTLYISSRQSDDVQRSSSSDIRFEKWKVGPSFRRFLQRLQAHLHEEFHVADSIKSSRASGLTRDSQATTTLMKKERTKQVEVSSSRHIFRVGRIRRRNNSRWCPLNSSASV